MCKETKKRKGKHPVDLCPLLSLSYLFKDARRIYFFLSVEVIFHFSIHTVHTALLNSVKLQMLELGCMLSSSLARHIKQAAVQNCHERILFELELNNGLHGCRMKKLSNFPPKSHWIVVCINATLHYVTFYPFIVGIYSYKRLFFLYFFLLMPPTWRHLW